MNLKPDFIGVSFGLWFESTECDRSQGWPLLIGTDIYQGKGRSVFWLAILVKLCNTVTLARN